MCIDCTVTLELPVRSLDLCPPPPGGKCLRRLEARSAGELISTPGGSERPGQEAL